APGPRRLGSRSRPEPWSGLRRGSLGRYSWRLPQPRGGGGTLLLSSLLVLFELELKSNVRPLLYDGPMSTRARELAEPSSASSSGTDTVTPPSASHLNGY